MTRGVRGEPPGEPIRFRTSTPPAAKARLSPGLIAKLRKRLRLSLDEFAALLDASSGSVFNWEHGKSKPSPAMRARLVAVRQLGRREARRLVKAKIQAKPTR